MKNIKPKSCKQGKALLQDLGTIKGEGKENTGNVFTHKSNAKKQIEACITDLFQNSFETMSYSVEMTEFAKKKGGNL